MKEQPFAITLDVGSSRANKTGSWRTERPEYVHRQAPCGHACPAGEDVQAWLYDAEEGEYERAWRHIVTENPFPAVMGRVCYHPCETACNRTQVDEAVAGLNRDELIEVLWREGVLARRYFYPGCHRVEPYRSAYPEDRWELPVTNQIAARVLVSRLDSSGNLGLWMHGGAGWGAPVAGDGQHGPTGFAGVLLSFQPFVKRFTYTCVTSCGSWSAVRLVAALSKATARPSELSFGSSLLFLPKLKSSSNVSPTPLLPSYRSTATTRPSTSSSFVPQRRNRSSV